MKLDLVETWLNMVSLSHSDSSRTREAYISSFRLFCDFIGKTPEQIKAEYENSRDREFRIRYAGYIKAFMSAEYQKEAAPCTIGCRVAAVKSFFKYNDLPLGYIPSPKLRIKYHNRDITHEELKLILGASRPREKAFFTLMAQSGLRPFTICNLKLKHVKEDLLQNRVPCKIDVPEEIAKGKYRGHFTFIAHEAVKYLKAYFNTRRNVTDNDFLFVRQGSKQQASPKALSILFSRTLQKLHEKGLIEVEQEEKNKPRDLRLYSLRKFFRKHANQAGFEFVQFWMGHVVKTGQEEHYRPTDAEFHRKLYAEKAMPFLRLESATPTDTEKIIAELRDQLNARDKEIDVLKEKIAKLQPVIEFVNGFDRPAELKEILDLIIADSQYPEGHLLRPIETEFSPSITKVLDEIAKKRGITRAEAVQVLVNDDWERFLEGQKKFEEMAKARGLPMTREEYEAKRKEYLKKHKRKE